MNAGELTHSESQLGWLADELTSVVDRLETDWRHHGVVSADLADEVHHLRQRAESLLRVPA